MRNWVYWHLLLLVISSSASAVEFVDDNLALMDVVYERQRLGSGLNIYLDRDTYYLPLVDLVSLLEMDISTQAQGASGRISASGSSFLLEQANGNWHVKIDSKEETIDAKSIAVDDELIYITPALARQWFGISLDPNFSESIFYLKSTKNLPFEQRIQRQNRKVSTMQFEEAVKEPTLNQPYALFEPPSVDVRLNHTARQNIKDDKSTSPDSTYYSAITTGDMLGMNTQTFWTGSRENGLHNFSLRMDRYDPDQSMAGVLGLSQISMGDISHPTFAGAPGSYGRGIVIGNSPVYTNSNRDIRDIEGDYFANWDVELYLGGALIGFQKTDASGHYLFKDVAVFEGDNAFTLKFYGPSGEIEVKEQHIAIGASTDTRHPLSFALSLSQPSRKVYEVNENVPVDVDSDVDQGVLTTGVQILPNFSITAAALERRTADAEQRYYNLGMRAGFLGTQLSFSATSDGSDELAYYYNMGGFFLGTLYNLGISEKAETRNYNLALNRRLGKDGSFILQSYKSESETLVSQTHRLGLAGRVAAVNWNHVLEYQSLDNFVDHSEDFEYLSGALFFSTSLPWISVRTNFGYDILPESQLRTVGISASGNLDPRTQLYFTIDRNLLVSDTSYRLAMNWGLENMLITPSISYSKSGWIQGNIGISASLGRRNGRVGNYYRLSSRPALTKGDVKFRLFEDEDQDGSYDLGEPLLSGGEMQAVQGHRKDRSNKGGIAWLESLTPWKPTDIVLREDSIDAASLKKSIKPFSVVPRPGKVIEIDIPFTRVGDIDGAVYREEKGNIDPARGVSVILKNKKGEVVQQQTTDSEGFFDFLKMAPGQYTLSIKEEAIRSTTHPIITITSKGDYVSGVEVLIGATKKERTGFELLNNLSGENNTPASSTDMESNTPQMNPAAPIVESFKLNVEPALVAEPILSESEMDVTVGDDIEANLLINEGDKQQSQKSASVNVNKNNPDVTIGKWALQAASYSTALAAQDFVKRIESKGESAFIKQVVVNNKNYFRVYIGNFSNQDQAVKKKTIVDDKYKIKSIVSKP